MTYKEALTDAMTELGKREDTCCIGYNCRFGKAAGTLNGFPEDRLFEMPLAENLLCGAAIGLSLEGWVPLIWLERFDFFTCGADAIVNHLAKLNELSDGIHKPAAIIRCVVGNSETPLFTGPTHCQNFTKAVREMVDFPVQELHHKTMIGQHYAAAYRNAKAGMSTMLVEFKDLWNQ